MNELMSEHQKVDNITDANEHANTFIFCYVVVF